MSRTIVRRFDVTIPAGTLKAVPLVTTTRFAPSVVDKVMWQFPSGCNGTVGIQVGARGVAVIPADASQFYVASGDSGGIDTADMHTTGDWSVIGYNTGSLPHTISVTFHTHIAEPPQQHDFIVDSVGMLLGMGES